jgi:nucleoside 2-deoxyribosyltransferase
MFYFATPHAKTNTQTYELDSEKLDRNSYYTKILENNGFKIFLPIRDADQSLSGKKLLEKELEVIKESDGIIAVLSDTRGVYMEIGYAKAFNKKIIGLKVSETRDFSDWGKAFFDYIASDEKDLLNYLSANFKKS